MRLQELQEQTMFLYHGTCSSNLPTILGKSKEKLPLPGVTSAYWGTREIAEYYAQDACPGEGEPVLIKIPFNQFQKHLLAPDRASAEEPITTVLGMDEDEVHEMWEESPQNWEASLEILGSVRYMGTIKVTKQDVVYL